MEASARPALPRPAALPGSLPESLPGSLPAALPGSLPAALPAVLPAPLPGSLPESLPESLPGSLPAILPAPLPGSLPGSLPESLPAAHMPPPDLCFQRPPPDTPSLPRADSEEMVTYISEGMTVTSADEEKLQLLNKNTELRRLNKELVKLNQEWDRIYHSTARGLQQKVRALQQEMLSLRQLTERLAAKLDREQSKSEYYEQTLIQELKKNQQLQEHVRQLEGNRHRGQDGRHALASPERAAAPRPPPQGGCGQRAPSSGQPDKEVTDLKEQLEALKCQTEIYEADYRTEHRDRERVEAENEKLRKKEEEMRLQMVLLQEQLKIFEDDFRKERSDKQLLQRLLKSKSTSREPVLVHRCNGHDKPGPPASSAPSCGRHCEKPSHKQGEHAGRSEAHIPAFGGDY